MNSFKQVRVARVMWLAAVAAAVGLAAAPAARAVDNTWTNAAATSAWNLTDGNWTNPVVWDNATNNGAVFGATGVGPIAVASGIQARGMNFQVAGYTLNGGDITLVNTGTGTIAANNVTAASAATINSNILSTIGMTKLGAGTLTLGGTGNNITGNIAVATSGQNVNVLIGSGTATTVGGVIALANATALPATTVVGVGNGALNLGPNNVTLGGLTLVNTTSGSAVRPTSGVFGTGTLSLADNTVRVIGNSTGFGYTFGANLNTGSGLTLAIGSGSNGNNELVVTGNITGGGGVLYNAGVSSTGAASNGGITLSGNNAFSGGFTVNNTSTSGALFTTDTAFGTGLITMNAGAIGPGGTGTRTVANNVLVGGNFTFSGSTGAAAVFTGGVDLNATGAAATRSITVNSGVTITLSGPVTNSGAAGTLTKAGTGTLILGNAGNLYAGGTNINAGILAIPSAAVLPSGTLTLGGGTLRFDFAGSFARDMTHSTSSTLNTNGNNITYSGNITGAGATLTKSGAGTLAVTTAQGYTGATTVTGGVLSLVDNGALAGTGTKTANGGATLRIDNSGSANLGDRLAGNVTLSTGTLEFIAAAAGSSSEAFGTLSVASGNNVVTVNTNGGAGATLTAGGYTAPTAGNSVLFRGQGLGTAGGAQIFLTGVADGATLANALGDTSPTGTGSFLVENSTANGVREVTYTTGPTITNTTPPGPNHLIDQPTTTTGSPVINSLTFAPAVSGTPAVDASSGTLTLTSGTTLVRPGVTGAAINGGTLAYGTAAAGFATNSDLAVSSSLTGTGGLTKNGPGVLTLSGNYGLTGSIAANAGTLALTTSNNVSATTLTGTGTVQIGSGRTLTLTTPTQTVAASLTGPGGLTYAPTGTTGVTLTLSGNNSHAGGTTAAVGNGNVRFLITSPSAFGTGPVSVNNTSTTTGSITFVTFNSGTATFTNDFSFVTAGGNTTAITQAANQTTTLAGQITGGNAAANTAFRVTGPTDDSTTFVFTNPANSFTAAITVFEGVLAITSDAALGNTANAVNLNVTALTTNPQVGGLRFDANNITLAATRPVSLVDAGGINTQAFNAEVAGVVSGAGTFFKVGTGTLTLSNPANSFTGALQVLAGTVSVPSIAAAGTNQPLGAAPATTAITLGTATTGGALEYTGAADAALGRPIVVGGAGGGTVRATSAGNTLTLNAPTAVDAGANPVTFDGAGNITVATPITGTGTTSTLTKTGGGRLELQAANTYAGNTTVAGGTLALTGTGSFASSPVITVGPTAAGPTLDVTGVTGGPFALAAGQTLKGFGSVVGNMAVPAGTTVAPGGSIGTLNEIGDLVLDGTYLAEVDSAALGQNADLLAVTGNLTLGPASVLSLPGTNTYDGTTAYTLATYGGTLTGTFGNFPTGTEPSLPAGYTLSYGDGTNDAITLTPTPVPEPGTLALTGLAVAGAAGWWKRRRTAAV